MEMTLRQLWTDALSGIALVHPQRWSPSSGSDLGGACVGRFSLSPETEPVITLWAENVFDTVTNRLIPRLVVSCVRLTFWPGVDAARAWLVCAWACYVQHEALELCVLAGGQRVLDPHAVGRRCDRGLRDGLPERLTAETILDAMEIAMGRDEARAYLTQSMSEREP